MATYTYKEITNALLACGFVEEKNNHGSHQNFVHPVTGFKQPVPKHSNGIVASGTAESILEYAVMQARIANLNIASDRYKLSKNVIEFIKKHHAKIKQNLLFLVPDKVRLQNGLHSVEDVKKFINEKIKQTKKAYQNKHQIDMQR